MTPCANNVFTRNLNYGATTADRTVGMVLRCASNMLVANNTFHGLQYFVFAISHNRPGWGGPVDGLRILNNVISISTGKIYGLETALPASVVIDNNVVQASGTATLASVPGKGSTTSLATLRNWTGYEVHGLQADPLFMDRAGHDYRLRAESPAVDAAQVVSGVTDGFIGAGPDAGYHERR